MTLLGWVGDLLRAHPEIALFLALAIGYAIGQIKFGPIQLGGICGTLIAALVIGQLGVTLEPSVKNVFFMLFIFALGYAGGPQFFANLNAKGLRIGLLCLIEVVVVLTLVLLATHFMKLDPGTAAGMMAGAATESAVVGTATDAISKLALPPEQIHQLQANVVTAYSITYIFGLITIVVVTSQLFPLILRVNLREEADRLWKAMGGEVDDANATAAAPELVGRVYEVRAVGGSVARLTERLGGSGSVQGLIRHGRPLPVTQDTAFEVGDRVLVIGHRRTLVDAIQSVGPGMAEESGDVAAFGLVLQSATLVLRNEAVQGLRLRDLSLPGANGAAPPVGDSVLVGKVSRGTQSMPLLPDLKLQLGDRLEVFGTAEQIGPAVKSLGEPVLKSVKSNIALASAGIVLGVFIGMFSVKVGGVPLSLGTGGGALLTGLVFGWFQARHPSRLSLPDDALNLLKDIGLATFIACVGLASGPQALELVHKYGVSLPLMGVVIAVLPAFCSLMVGHHLLKIDVPVLFGAIAGQQCSTPALSAIQSAAGNTTPLLGYTITYAISNVILPLMGPVIVALAGLANPG
ncbi:aspartate-alanine antiporter [Variovorax dokdonensis]|uniref:Aspartate-alanine antiporter n=1 Tax=Variovorax dokdonensis TaxID=344883 RepID=A0ABT7NG82_9BURK|nr:aspartate-alanine antiporter [Variovorax dokdonensis]MDM0046959.1 aspartate-alanine antiporter [Variovorax dokdonensis]